MLLWNTRLKEEERDNPFRATSSQVTMHVKSTTNSPYENCFLNYILNIPFNTSKIMGIAKPCTHLHPAPSTSTQLISTSTQLHPPPHSLFQPPPSSLQHPQQYSNQNIARNWAISPNLGRKI